MIPQGSTLELRGSLSTPDGAPHTVMLFRDHAGGLHLVDEPVTAAAGALPPPSYGDGEALPIWTAAGQSYRRGLGKNATTAVAIIETVGKWLFLIVLAGCLCAMGIIWIGSRV